jgi:hypothetical protein
VKVTNSALTGIAAAETHVIVTNANPTGGHIDVTLTNIGGTGSAHVVGDVVKNGNVVSTKLDVTFDHWTDAETNITLDGGLHEVGTFSAPLPLSGDVEVTGALAASGSVSGTVDFDVKGSYSASGVSVNGHVGGQSIDVNLGIKH